MQLAPGTDVASNLIPTHGDAAFDQPPSVPIRFVLRLFTTTELHRPSGATVTRARLRDLSHG